MRNILASEKAYNIIIDSLKGTAEELYAYKLGNLDSCEDLEEFIDDNCNKNYIAKGEDIEDVEEYIEIATFNNNEEIEPNFEALEGSIIWR
uniref:Uncharacterized protein n=1 Tax=Siphoviridae sp. ctnsL8 TaxID=2825666 RepID=A0A8S5PN41_9CAUD|nr:MAG TPA: hypothetical protein [Siphoviridae sp. ctnsL8]DAR92119.1 MAG TPA: hypothetical protein [Caudoviricetes sp.]